VGTATAALIIGAICATVGVLHWYQPYAFDRFGISWLFGMPTRSLSPRARRLGAAFTVMLGIAVATLGALSMIAR